MIRRIDAGAVVLLVSSDTPGQVRAVSPDGASITLAYTRDGLGDLIDALQSCRDLKAGR